MVNLVSGGDSEKNIQQISLSDNTVSRRIEEMSIDIKEQPLETTNKAEDIMKEVPNYFSELGLSWKNVCAVCTDGAPAMLGPKSGFVSRVKEIAPGVTVTHCTCI
ncbi:protein FAM200C-like [Macrobrachium nipponense]|uniref:protein FAM200C-like n=1 Tax=Macrobrachium nipponense TaxID=159736 RepID=UPI0030C84928